MGKKIGIIGSGIVGQTLANGFLKHGYDVTLGTNDPGKREALESKTSGKANIGSFEETARFGEILVLAVKGTAAEAAVTAAGVTIWPARPSSTRPIQLPMRLRSTASFDSSPLWTLR